jgi:hypothetical protein
MITELSEYLRVKGVGNYVGYIPDLEGVFLIDTGGVAPENWGRILNPTFQVFIKDTRYRDGLNKFNQINDLLTDITNTYLVGSSFYYYFVELMGNGYLGLDEDGTYIFSSNFIAKVRGEPRRIQTGSSMGLLLALTYQV